MHNVTSSLNEMMSELHQKNGFFNFWPLKQQCQSDAIGIAQVDETLKRISGFELDIAGDVGFNARPKGQALLIVL